MADPVPVLLIGATPATAGATVAATPQGAALTLQLPVGRTLGTAQLRLAAAAGADASRALTVAVTSETGALGGSVRTVTARLAAPAAVTGVQITTSEQAARPVAARLRLFRGGVWQPLTPLDIVATGAMQTVPPAVAAAINAEMLARDGSPPAPVYLPATVAVTAMAVNGTAQPCGVAVAVGEDPPFFSAPDPLPVTPVTVDGLARAANRYLSDTPGARAVPLRLIAASDATVVITSFSATLAPLPPSPPPPDPAPAGPVETVWIDTPAPAQAQAAQLCDGSHWAAQRFPPVTPGASLSSVFGYLRAVGGAASGALAVHADAGGHPADLPLPDAAVAFDLPAGGGAGWAGGSLAKAATVAQPWWLVCRMSAGACCWYTGSAVPAAAPPNAGLMRRGTNVWAPAPAVGQGWLQARLLTTVTG